MILKFTKILTSEAKKTSEAEKLTQNDIDDEMDFLDDMILSNKSNSRVCWIFYLNVLLFWFYFP